MGSAPIGERLAEAVHDRRRIQGVTSHSLIHAERAVQGSAQRELRRIERTMYSKRLPGPCPITGTGDPERVDRFLWAAARCLGFASGALLLISGRQYESVLCGEGAGGPMGLHFRLGEGPAIDALESGTVIEVKDFYRSATQWPAFSQAVLDIGIRAALYIPLISAQPGMVLAFWDTRPRTAARTPGRCPGSAEDDPPIQRIQRTAEVLLCERSDVITTQQLLGHIDRTVMKRAAIYQAAGYLSAYLAIKPSDALNLLRLQAWADQRPLEDLCEEVLGDA